MLPIPNALYCEFFGVQQSTGSYFAIGGNKTMTSSDLFVSTIQNEDLLGSDALLSFLISERRAYRATFYDFLHEFALLDPIYYLMLSKDFAHVFSANAYNRGGEIRHA